MKKLVYACALFVGMIGCATPYQAKSEGLLRGGYQDQDMGDGRFVVSYDGNGYTSSATVQMFAFRRAKEVCTINGYKTFSILHSESGSDPFVYANQGTVVAGEFPHITLMVQCHN